MITSIELISAIRKVVLNSGVKSLINGDIYLGNRPTNSLKNDIVIGSLSVTNGVINNSVILINIYAKDIKDNTTFYPDFLALKKPTEHLIPFLNEVFLKDVKTWIEVDSQRDYKVEGVQEWVSTIRVNTRTIE